MSGPSSSTLLRVARRRTPPRPERTTPIVRRREDAVGCVATGPATIEWTNEPVALALSDYETLKSGFIRKISGVPGVRAIYEHRGPGYEPGISDIDLIVVCDEKLPQGAATQLQLNMDDPHSKDIYRGGPVIIPASLFAAPV